MANGLDFVAADMPDANTLTIHIIAAMAQHEADEVSKRTKRALDQINRNIESNGYHLSRSGRSISRLGGAGWSVEDRIKGPQARREVARSNPRNTTAYAYMSALIGDNSPGLADWDAIVRGLNAGSFLTSTGKPFTKSNAKQLYRRMRS